MVKAILFDFWGTLVENGVWSPIKQVRNILQINVPFPEYVVRMERAMMTSKFDNLKSAFQNVCQEFGINCPEDRMEELIGMWNKNWMLAHPYEEVKEALLTLKGKYKLILVSNTDCFGVQKVLDKFEFEPLFDKMYLSYKTGMIKTDKSFFKMVLDENNLSVQDCLMVGDSLQSDIMTAKRIGIKAVLIDRKGRRDFQPKISNLKELQENI
jgi:HAD superfamily hydrolase (TIGR01549 family)